MAQRLFLLLLLGVFAPNFSLASVTIHEIAWMGTTESANDEWIELYNSGPGEVLLDGWVLTDGQALTISLAGSLAAGQYAVLERTDDSSAPGGAFLIYTGALTNAGATLKLLNSGGIVIDQIAGGENWESVGGDNTTKETAQYTPSGWITAEATPGKTNATEASSVAMAKTSNSSKNSSGSSGISAIRHVKNNTLVPSTDELQLSVSLPEVVYVGQPIVVTAEPDAIGKTIMDSLVFEWNFGDFLTATGKSAEHTYEYPGEYIITLRAHYVRHDQTLQVPLTVLPMRLSLARNSAGDILINNDSPYAVDVSGLTVAAAKKITFPPRSFISKGGTITVSKEKIGPLFMGQVQLVTPEKKSLAVLLPDVLPPPESEKIAVIPTAQPEIGRVPLVAPETFTFSNISDESEPDMVTVSNAVAETAATSTQSLAAATVVGSNDVFSKDMWPLFGLLGVIALGIVSVYTGSQKT